MIFNKFITTSLLVVGVALTSGCASKFHKGGLENLVFERLDINDDGKLNKKEHFHEVLSRFERIDKNKDGIITQKELESSIFSDIRSDFKAYYLKKYDLNEDGQVIKYELIKQTKEEFVTLDVNSDGFISKSEFKKEKASFKK